MGCFHPPPLTFQPMGPFHPPPLRHACHREDACNLAVDVIYQEEICKFFYLDAIRWCQYSEPEVHRMIRWWQYCIIEVHRLIGWWQHCIIEVHLGGQVWQYLQSFRPRVELSVQSQPGLEQKELEPKWLQTHTDTLSFASVLLLLLLVWLVFLLLQLLQQLTTSGNQK